jgi:hypothetical protein
MTTMTPSGFSSSQRTPATCSVSLSWSWGLRAKNSRIRGSFERPTIRSCGM